MRFVQQAKEFTATLRFRLVLWITVVVFAMVVVTNVAVREVAQFALAGSYDQFLIDSLEDVHSTVQRYDPDEKEQLFEELTAKVRANRNRNWFLQIFDEKKGVIWSSADPPQMTVPAFLGETNGPFDGRKHRVYEKKQRKASGELYYIRCGYLQRELQMDIEVLNNSILLATISIVLAAPLGAYIITLRATRPIKQIIATAAHLQPGNLEERLPIRGTGDEIDQLSKTINSMLDRLAIYIQHNREFVANAAHELRSPLAAMRTSVEVALNKGRTPEEYAVILGDVMEEIGRLAGLLNRLLLLAEGDAGRLASRDQRTRLDKIVRESVDMFEPVAEAQGVHLAIAELVPVVVPGDETYLRQVVRNLIDNAIKYNRNPGSVVVHLRADPTRKRACLIVKDSGIGIDPDMLPRVFDRFFRADKARSREHERAGHGLGLSICRSVVESLHGQITVESTAGTGATFTVLLPLIEDTSLPPSAEKQAFTTRMPPPSCN